jgi:DNA polymerase-1
VPDRPVLIVDGLNFFIRHFVANPSISDHGHHIGGLVGFLKGLWHLCDRVSPSRMVVVWEGGGSPRRRAIYENYKDKRRPQKLNRYYDDEIPDTPQNRNNQVTKIIEALKHVPVSQVYVSDCEADDLIAYLAKYTFNEQRCVIVSSDRDLYQLLSKRVIQWSPGQKKFITIKTLIEKFGISATNFCTARALIGDGSDKIDGVPRAGFASLAKRFPELSGNDFISVSEMINLAHQRVQDKKLKLFESMIAHKKIAMRNWKLMYLDTMNLSADQVKKMQYSIENSPPVGNKIALVKLMLREGISNFDIDTFYTSLNSRLQGNR